MAYTLDVTVPAGITGLTDLRAQLFDTVGANVGSAVSTGFVEIGTSGTYNWHYAAWPDGHRGGVKFYSNADATTLLAIASINPEEVENTDAKTSSVAASVWAAGTRTLTSFGTLVADIWSNVTRTLTSGGGITAADVWSHATRTLTDKTGFSLSSAGIQAIWDALTSALTTTGSIGKLLVDLYNSLIDNSVTVVAAINGDDITVYRGDTWSFSTTVSFTLTDYEAVALVVKQSESESDNDAQLLLRSDTGLIRVASAAAVSAGNGTLIINSASQFSVKVAISETSAVQPGVYTWWLKVFDTTPATDEGYTRVTGRFIVRNYGYRATG